MPKCCEECKNERKEDCGNHKKCVRWLSWFHEVWAAIRRDAEEIKRQNEE